MRAGPLAGVQVQGGEGEGVGGIWGRCTWGLGEVCRVRKGKGEESLQGPRAGVQVQGGDVEDRSGGDMGRVNTALGGVSSGTWPAQIAK